MSVKITTTIENIIERGFRKIKALRNGSKDTNTSYQAAPFGQDFQVPKNWRAVYAKTENSAEPIIVGFVSALVDESLVTGDNKLYSTNEAGDAVGIDLKLGSDGVLTICTAAEEHYSAVRYEKAC